MPLTDEEADDILKRHVNMLAEHFDSVIVLATGITEEGFTSLKVSRHGNYYAQRGMTMEWLAREDEKTREDVRPKDDGDGWKTGEGI